MATQEQIDQLDAIIAKGVERVQYGDHSVTYAKLADLMSLRATMKAQQDPNVEFRSYAVFGRD